MSSSNLTLREGFFSSCPEDIFNIILAGLNISDISSVVLVSTVWKKIADNWKDKFVQNVIFGEEHWTKHYGKAKIIPLPINIFYILNGQSPLDSSQTWSEDFDLIFISSDVNDEPNSLGATAKLAASPKNSI
jgi:hypothetical protein